MVTSSQNPIYKKALSLLQKKGIKEHGQCLVSGKKITLEISSSSPDKGFWIMEETMSLPPGEWNQTLELNKELFKNIDSLGTRSPIWCAALPEYQKYSDLQTSQPAIFCACGDPKNLGAILRSAAAFNVEQIVILKEAAHPFLPSAIRASSGTSFSHKLFPGPSIQDVCTEHSELYALDMNGSPLNQMKLPNDIHFLIGEEGLGVPNNFSGTKLSIPMNDNVESLNAAIATSILLYERSR